MGKHPQGVFIPKVFSAWHLFPTKKSASNSGPVTGVIYCFINRKFLKFTMALGIPQTSCINIYGSWKKGPITKMNHNYRDSLKIALFEAWNHPTKVGKIFVSWPPLSWKLFFFKSSHFAAFSFSRPVAIAASCAAWAALDPTFLAMGNLRVAQLRPPMPPTLQETRPY